MATGNEDLDQVLGMTISGALAKLMDEGMGSIEGTEFLVTAAARGAFVLDEEERLQAP